MLLNTNMAESSRAAIVELERRVLQVLCGGHADRSVRHTAKRLLTNYRWREPVHEVIFEALLSIPSDDPVFIRDQLPARMTRKGFPDVAWEEIFKPHALSKDQAEGLMMQLVLSI